MGSLPVVIDKLLYYTSTREIVLRHSTALSFLLDLMHDTNDTIRMVCNGALDIIAECDEAWAREIRLKQFQFHNGVWLDTVLGDEVHEVWRSMLSCLLGSICMHAGRCGLVHDQQ